MASSPPRSEILLVHPFADDTHIRPNNIRDALGNCVSTLHLVSELFSDEKGEFYDSAQVRRGVFLHLQSVASTLEAVDAYLGNEAIKATEERKAERHAEYEARRATEERIESDPEVIA
ncbi:MAG: hypothetical protein P9E24_04320, partial [Candidatus Competibacter sp.]|nr:hypothetical protein [Candidatus Competibacter sp.]MDG4584285.1 hypothetical protein [Candidatus Competibacter sp.]